MTSSNQANPKRRFVMKHKSAIFVLVLLALFALTLPALAADDATKAAAAALTVTAAAAIAVAIVQFIKGKIIPTIWDKLGDAGKFAVTVLASAGVTLYKYIFLEGLPLNFSAILFCGEVIIAATVGYEVLKGVAPTLSRTITNHK